MYLKGLFVLIVLLDSTNVQMWRRPKIMGDKIPLSAIMPNRKRVQSKILQYHNFFRTKVVPKAANMLRLKWHNGCANAAQKWAENCMFLKHDDETGRYVNGYGACGQNIFVSSQKVPWLFAIKTWWLEKDNFTYGSKWNNLDIVGHYTQMVWAATHQIGCGLAKCYKNGGFQGKLYYSYICNYCPIGNRQGQTGRPYRSGKPCNFCKKNCFARKLCMNSCSFADFWANCRQLYRTWPNWLCHSTSTQGLERKNYCRATCECRHKIRD